MRGSSIRLLVLVLGLLAFAIGSRLHTFSNALTPAQQQIRRALAMKLSLGEGMQHPAVILGGGSNVLTGLRASVLHERLHIPVYNLGLLNEGGDYRNSLALLERTARSGDLIVYSTRGLLMEAPFTEDAASFMLDKVSFRYPAEQGRFELGNRSLLRSLMPDNPNAEDPWIAPENYDALGDFHVCLGQGLRHTFPTVRNRIPHLQRFIRELAQFSQRMRERQVQVLILAPDVLVHEKDMAHWMGLYQQSVAALSEAGAEVIKLSPDTPFFTNPDEFCDLFIHPNEKHAIIKSRLLAEQLALRIK